MTISGSLPNHFVQGTEFPQIPYLIVKTETGHSILFEHNYWDLRFGDYIDSGRACVGFYKWTPGNSVIAEPHWTYVFGLFNKTKHNRYFGYMAMPSTGKPRSGVWLWAESNWEEEVFPGKDIFPKEYNQPSNPLIQDQTSIKPAGCFARKPDEVR
jgi:hypothetical protein